MHFFLSESLLFKYSADGGEVVAKWRSKEGSSIVLIFSLHLLVFLSSRLSLWSSCRVCLHTAISPCLTDLEAIDSRLVPSSVVVAVKDMVVVSSFVVEESMDATVNTVDVNVGRTPTSPNVNLKLGKRVAYPIVANYVRNTWGKYGLAKLMFNSFTEMFSFQLKKTKKKTKSNQNRTKTGSGVNVLGMERGFLSQKGWGGRGVKGKSGVVPSAKAVKDMVVVSSFVVEESMDATV
nr:hypothetical protein [Tanacetum cinerariifolium]